MSDYDRPFGHLLKSESFVYCSTPELDIDAIEHDVDTYGYDGKVYGYMVALIAEVRRLRVSSLTRWISASERLPDGGHDVLAIYADGMQALACHDRGRWRMTPGGHELGTPVTHWMPLPALPEVSK